jgi:hypothetical protein
MKIPSTLPEEFSFTGADYDDFRETITLDFRTDSGELVLRISQRYLSLDYQGIGPQAVVETVQVGKHKGEYVSGGWMIPEVKSGVDATSITSTPEVVWDADVKLKTLRWTDGEFLYEIALAGSSSQPPFLDKEALIRLAQHMH